MGYFGKTLKGISWMGLLRLITRFLSFVKIAVLARLLVPSEFGLFGIASLVLALLEILTDTGINAILIQDEFKIKKYLNTAWTLSIIRGFLISLMIITFAYPVSNFFNAPQAFKLLLLISVAPLIRGFINPLIIRFQKELEFNKEFFIRTSVFLIDALISIYFAYVLRSAVSIIYGLIAGIILELIISFILIKPTPSFKLEKEKVKNLIRRGKWITASGIFEYIFYNIDDILVGKMLNISALGYYQMAYKISTLPISESSEVVSKVTFPVLVKISDDKERIKRAYEKVFNSLIIFVVPFCILLIIFAQSFVKVVLGNNWMHIVPVLRILAIHGAIRAISGSTSTLFLAFKKQEYIFIVTLISMVTIVVFIYPFIRQFGIAGAALASLLGSISSLPFMYHFYKKIFKNNYEKS